MAATLLTKQLFIYCMIHVPNDYVPFSLGNDSDDDDSWENEDLPDVPLETPTLEGPARLPGIPNDHSSVLIIPGKVVQPGSSVSPTKRPRSSLEEVSTMTCLLKHIISEIPDCKKKYCEMVFATYGVMVVLVNLPI